MPNCCVAIFKTLRTVIKAIGLVDAFLDELEREKAAKQAEKDKARQRMSEIYQKASNLAGKENGQTNGK